MAEHEVGMYNSKDYEIKSLELINSGGQTVDLRKIFVELQIFQDLYSPVMNGNIMISDGHDVFNNFYFVGNEFLKIIIDKPGLQNPLERIFRVYKSSDRHPSTDSGQIYLLHFCSDELISSNQILVSKAYKSTKIKDIVEDILTKELNVEADRIFNLENTSGNFDFVVPNYRPFEAIQWATARAYDRNKFCYFFFENKQGFNLTSLQSLIKQPAYKTLKYEVKNIERDPSNNKDSIDKFRIINDFDMLNSISNGSFASRMMAIDIFNQSFVYHNYDLSIAEASGNLINKYKPVNSMTNSKNETLFEAKNSLFRTYLQVSDTLTEKSNDVKYWMMPRAMHMSIINNFRISVTIPGDIQLKVGDIVNYDFTAFESAREEGKKLDKYRTGRYLVASINHKFREDEFESIVELVSDSFASQLPEANGGLNRLVKKGK